MTEQLNPPKTNKYVWNWKSNEQIKCQFIGSPIWNEEIECWEIDIILPEDVLHYAIWDELDVRWELGED